MKYVALMLCVAWGLAVGFPSTGWAQARSPGVDALDPNAPVPVTATKRAAPTVNTEPEMETSAAQPIEIDADRLESDTKRKMLIGVGNVTVSYGPVTLKADYIEVNTETQEGYAKGNVVLEQPGQMWEGEELRGNLKTREFDFGTFELYKEPFYITAEDSTRTGKDTYELINATLTTCEGDKPGYMLRAKNATVVAGSHLKASGAVIYMGGVPVFWWPYVKKDLAERKTNIDVVPGYSSRLGAFLLSSYNYRINPYVDGATKLDYRTERGFGIGQDFRWRDKGVQKDWKGQFRAYYADDKDPLQKEEDQELYGDLVTNERYRFKFEHRQNFSPRDYVLAEFNYLSDPLVLEDFFDDEYRHNAQPENRATYTHRDNRYTFNAEATTRLNDFYDNLNRLPELSLDFQRQQLGQTPFFYQGATTVSSLEQVFMEGSSSEDYEADRFDTLHEIVYPTRSFGWLNFTPRIGGRATYYSDTIESTTITNLVTSVDTNGVSTVDEEIGVMTTSMGSDTRTTGELGFETSFKAFGVIHENPGTFGKGLRHVIEPFANYTYTPEPSVLPENLYQFDRIDTVEAANEVRLGLRNKLQTKLGSRVHDLLDFAFYTDYYIDPVDEAASLSPMVFDLELRPSKRFMVDADAVYDFDLSTLDRFTTQVGMFAEDRSSVNVEYRFFEEDRSLLSGEVRLFPKKPWSFSGYWRYEFETGDLEEHAYSVIRTTDCLGYGLGVKQIADDVTVWAQIWLTALPQTAVELGR